MANGNNGNNGVAKMAWHREKANKMASSIIGSMAAINESGKMAWRISSGKHGKATKWRHRRKNGENNNSKMKTRVKKWRNGNEMAAA
jgi:hypothetical protein